MIELNKVFLDRMKGLLGNDFESFVASLSLPQVKSILVNQNKISIENFQNIADFPIEQIPYEHAGFYVDETLTGRHALHHAGAMYFQEPSAMFTVNAIKFNGNEKVLDMCAAPGGKSIQIANRIPNGVLVSNEITKARSEILYSNIERMGLKNVIITNDTPANLSKAYANEFDVCLVDAPCSGEGMFRKGADMIDSWNPGLNELCAARQLEILECANKTLKMGGILIYSTCTYSVEENENVVNKFLSAHNYKLLQIESEFIKSRGVNMPEAVRLYPHNNKGEGQFVAVLQKNEESDFSSTNHVKLKTSHLANEFVKNVVGKDLKCYEFFNSIYLTPCEKLVKKGVNYVSIGVKIGIMNNKRFEPFHNLFTALGKEFLIKLDCDFNSDLTKKYLKGETFEVDLPDGYGAFLINGCPSGGFKISRGQFKNYYPKGLRNFK